MTPAPLPDQAHPVRRRVAALHQELDEALGLPVWSLAPGETGEALREVFALEAKLAALKLGLLAHAESPGVDLPRHEAATSMIAWLRHHTGLPPTQGKQLMRLAHALPQHPATQQALAAGAVSAPAAGVIVTAVEALPEVVDAPLREQGEHHLLAHATRFDTRQLQVLGQRLHEVLDPESAEQREAEHLTRLEAHAARETFLQLSHHEQAGVTDITARIPLLAGLKLARQIEALLNPARPDPLPTIPVTNEHGIGLSTAERRGHAFTELIDHIPAKHLPQTGGCDPVIVITMDLDTLLGRLKPVVLDTGHRISPSLARRLAAKHGIIPAILGSTSQVLDLGRKTRLFTTKQRLAMSIAQHGTCAEEHCDRPTTWADAHHLVPWHTSGPTNLNNGVLLCRRHHTYADHPDYTLTRLAPGRVRIKRRT